MWYAKFKSSIMNILFMLIGFQVSLIRAPVQIPINIQKQNLVNTVAWFDTPS